MDQKAPQPETLATPSETSRVALGVLALCFALSVMGRGLGESFTVFLKPISESFGWNRGDVVSVYSLAALTGGLASPLIGRLFDRFGPLTVYALGLLLLGGGLPDRRLFAFAVAVPVQPRLLRRHRHRFHRQCAEFDPARPLVRPAAADRDGGGLFGHRRRSPDPVAGIAIADRSSAVARRLSDAGQHHPAAVAATAGATLAAVLRRLARTGKRFRGGSS